MHNDANVRQEGFFPDWEESGIKFRHDFSPYFSFFLDPERLKEPTQSWGSFQFEGPFQVEGPFQLLMKTVTIGSFQIL